MMLAHKMFQIVAMFALFMYADVHDDPVLSPLVDANFVFRCQEPACGEVIRRGAPGCSYRHFRPQCAKHMWVHHRFVNQLVLRLKISLSYFFVFLSAQAH